MNKTKQNITDRFPSFHFVSSFHALPCCSHHIVPRAALFVAPHALPPAPHCSLMLDCIISHPNRVSGYSHIMSSSLSLSLFVSCSKSRKYKERKERKEERRERRKRERADNEAKNEHRRESTHTLCLFMQATTTRIRFFISFLSTFKMDLSRSVCLSVCLCVFV
ncbi:hypothetical protein K457DRAFT_183455 [Linnemannia elongata AG-77]|uniref:Uncharacterized protein n=1 Tax=Linnemannia elongata AG-77 TaxID=1314771 RepID=A0A197K863_9FUNG|nr:hypothetical protein K457DRAFT_183455 [Linnemannia elongata AG-77]